nr:GPP34 family phosphoprotein [Kibdelosporangium sp. MJ126-NF4]CEL19915.1 hypothetical protein [Kibdelosporangium sp. MJ126-NF4]CTQ97139.1 hypothetical protein [Kibdelosporangium sp. MJ126-NF4]
MLAAHDLLLLVLDDETGKILPGLPMVDTALAGAVLVDLTVRGLVDLTGEHDHGRKGRLIMRSGQLPPEPVMQQGLNVISQLQGRKPDAALKPLAKGLRDQLAAELIHAGILRREEHKVLGLFRTNRLPANDSSYEAELRARLWHVLSGEVAPDWRTGPLIALLHAMNAVTTVISVPNKRAAKRRAKEIAYGTWASEAVRRAVQAMQAAVIASVIAATSASSPG